VSDDEGVTWNIEFEYPTCTTTHVSSMGFVNDDIGYMAELKLSVESVGVINKMINGVDYSYLSYQINLVGINSFYSKTEMYDADIAYFFSGDILLKTIDGGVYVNAVDELLDQCVSVLPNPSHSIIRISTDFLIEKLIIRDLTGKELTSSSNDSINISNLPQGTYLLNIIFIDKRVLTKKIIVD